MGKNNNFLTYYYYTRSFFSFFFFCYAVRCPCGLAFFLLVIYVARKATLTIRSAEIRSDLKNFQ
jgi:hypothetical protein